MLSGSLTEMIKVCPECRSTWAGGRRCEDCGATLRDPYGEDAKTLPGGMWKYIRLQYGARRGMIVRVMAFLLGPVVAAVLGRRAIALPPPWVVPGVIGALIAGFLTWALIYWAAGKAVRLWVLRKGQVQKRKLARAMLKKMVGKGTV